MGIGTHDSANLQAHLKNSRFEWESSQIKMFNIGTHASPQHMFGIGNTAAAPAAGSAGWGQGAVYIARTGASASGVVWVNNGSGTSSTFQAAGT